MSSVNNATNDQHHHNTNFGISSKKINTYDTFHPTYLVSALLTQNIECLFSVHIPSLSLNDKKFESCTQDKCYKPNNQVISFSGTCLFKTMIISDMIYFIKAISSSKTTHVSTKQGLAVIYADF